MNATTHHLRREDTEAHQVGQYYTGAKRYFDHTSEQTVVKLFTGDCYITNALDEMLITILGSCIAACIRDPIAQIGGMNHFLLPGDADRPDIADQGTRYGVNAMEQLINGILSRGGRKERLEVKLFGGGNVTNSNALIGSKNVAFIRRFMRDEGLPVMAEHLGGEYPRRIHYTPATGSVKMRLLRRANDMKVADYEQRFAVSVQVSPLEGSIDLFG